MGGNGGELILFFSYIFFILMGLAVATYDFLYFKIPNSLVLAIIILFFIKFPFETDLLQIYLPIITFFTFLIGGFIAFKLGWLGAGDVKYLAATSLWAVPGHLVNFLLVTVIAGGILGLIYMVMGKQIDLLKVGLAKAAEALEEKVPAFKSIFAKIGFAGGIVHDVPVTSRQRRLPYGVAIYIGSLYFSLDKIGF